MIRAVLLAISVVLPTVPFILLTAMGNTVLGVSIIAILALVGLLGALTNNPHYESWLSLALALIVSLASQGYIPYLLHIALTRITNEAIYDGSIVLPEYSLITSYLYRSYVRYTREFGVKGFDKAEYDRELNALVAWTMALVTVALAISLLLLYIVTSVTITVVDPFTALLVLAVTYVIIHRYVVGRIRR